MSPTNTLPNRRMQVHSSGGRALMTFALVMSVCMGVSAVVLTLVFLVRGTHWNMVVLGPFNAITAVALFVYLREARAPVFMTPEGIELGRPARLVPWPQVAGIEELWYGGLLIQLCRISFRDGTPPLTLYVDGEALDVLRARLGTGGMT